MCLSCFPSPSPAFLIALCAIVYCHLSISPRMCNRCVQVLCSGLSPGSSLSFSCVSLSKSSLKSCFLPTQATHSHSSSALVSTLLSPHSTSLYSSPLTNLPCMLYLVVPLVRIFSTYACSLFSGNFICRARSVLPSSPLLLSCFLSSHTLQTHSFVRRTTSSKLVAHKPISRFIIIIVSHCIHAPSNKKFFSFHTEF